MKKLVSLVKEKSRSENLQKALELIKKDLTGFKKAKKVLLKPNFTSVYNPTASTQREAIETILEFFKDFDENFAQKEILIGETSGEALTRKVGFQKIFEKYTNVRYWDMTKERQFYAFSIKAISGKIKVRIPKKIFKLDYKISVALPKTHDTVGVTLGIKNFLMGIIKQEDKSLMHGLDNHNQRGFASLMNQIAPWQMVWLFNNYAPSFLKDKLTGFNADYFIKSVVCLHRNLCSIGKRILPNLVVIDGWEGMEADGPVYGRRRKLGVAIASTDPVKADAVGAKVIGFEPAEIGYLRLLAEAGKGELSLESTVDEKIGSVAQKFLPHRHYCYQLKAD